MRTFEKLKIVWKNETVNDMRGNYDIKNLNPSKNPYTNRTKRQVTQDIKSIINIPENSMVNCEVEKRGIKLGLFNGLNYIAEGHDIDECNDEIAKLFGVAD